MLTYIWPIALVVFSNVLYQICAKSAPEGMHPMASLTVTYAMAALSSMALYFLMNPGGNLLREYTAISWATPVMGVVIVGLEAGFLYAYKAGWPVSTASMVQSAFLAIALVFVGALLYHEAITWNKVLGLAICMAGLVILIR